MVSGKLKVGKCPKLGRRCCWSSETFFLSTRSSFRVLSIEPSSFSSTFCFSFSKFETFFGLCYEFGNVDGSWIEIFSPFSCANGIFSDSLLYLYSSFGNETAFGTFSGSSTYPYSSFENGIVPGSYFEILFLCGSNAVSSYHWISNADPYFLILNFLSHTFLTCSPLCNLQALGLVQL